MDQETTDKSASKPSTTNSTSVSIGGNVGGNVIAGDNNTQGEGTKAQPWYLELLSSIAKAFGWKT